MLQYICVYHSITLYTLNLNNVICLLKVLVTQLYTTLCNPMDCSLPGSSVHAILQGRILQRVAIPFSREYS